MGEIGGHRSHAPRAHSAVLTFFSGVPPRPGCCRFRDFAAGAGLLVAVLPYMIELVGSSIFGHATAPDISMSMILTLALLQNGIIRARGGLP